RRALVARTQHTAPDVVQAQHATQQIVTTGEALKQQLANENGFDAARMTSVPAGVDLERFRPRDAREARRALGLHAERSYLGIVATLRNWKGHTYLLQAFAALSKHYPAW